MKQVQRVLTLALALFLVVGIPAVGLAGGDKAGKSATDTSTTDKSSGSASPSTSGGASGSTTTSSGGASGSVSGSAGQASPMTAADCKTDFKKHGFKSEAECTAKLKK